MTVTARPRGRVQDATQSAAVCVSAPDFIRPCLTGPFAILTAAIELLKASDDLDAPTMHLNAIAMSAVSAESVKKVATFPDDSILMGVLF